MTAPETSADLLRRYVLDGLVRTEREVSWQAQFDTLTGLPNRASVIRELAQRLRRPGAIPPVLLERLEDERALQSVELVLQRLRPRRQSRVA